MKRVFFVFCLPALLLLTGCCTSRQVRPLTLTAESRYQIVLPDTAPNSGTLRHLRTGAEMLQRSFRAALGTEMPIVNEAKAAPDMPAICIGDTRRARRAGIEAGKYPDFAFTIQVREKDIFIVGMDDHNYHRTTETNAGPWRFTLGSFNGMIRFAEDYLGTRFLYPGKWGEDLPARTAEITLPGNLHREVFPPLLMSRSRYQDPFYCYANNGYGGGSSLSYGGHSYYDAVPAKKYGKSHPEYFALVGEKRDPTGNHLCISNPTVQEMIYQEMAGHARRGAKIIQLAQTDGYTPCQCENCRRFGNTDDPGEKLWILHVAMARRLQKEYPGHFAHIIAYGPTKNPPKTIRKFPANVIVELCSYSEEDFAAWSKVDVPGGFTTYIYNWGYYNQTGMTPKMTPKTCAEQVRLFLKNHVCGLYRCGFGENYGLEGPTYYVYGKMFNDPGQNYHAVLDDFYRRAYHRAYLPMRSFHEALNARLAMYYRLKGDQSLEGGMENDNLLPNNPRVILAAIYTPDLLDSMEKSLSRAEELAVGDEAVVQRLKLVRFEFNYVSNLGRILHLYNAYRIRPSQENFNQLAELIEERNAMIDKCFRKNGSNRSVPGWPFSYFDHASRKMVQCNGRLAAPIGSPLSWNIGLLREKKILPGVGRKSVRVQPVRGGVSFGDFEGGCWSRSEWQHLGGIQLGEISSRTRFKVLYGEKALFFAVVSDIPVDRKYAVAGPDGRIWGQDCIEIMLDPFGTREIYYHLAYNPVENSYYDAAFGLITDVLHPKYNQCDEAWNGKWSYRTRRQGDKWYSLVEIPYSTLKAEQPRKGAVWLMNLGREDIGSALELSLWSPNLETMSFHDRESFGELVFE